MGDVPVGLPVIGDWSNDGVHDLIITTPHGYYGIVLEQRMGSGIMAVLMWCTLLVALIATLIARYAKSVALPPSFVLFSWFVHLSLVL